MAAAERRGYEYYAITDHAPNLIMQRMTDEKMLAQRAQVRALDASLELLHGTELFRACARTGTALEINASPQRLDLPSDHIRAARDAGVKFAIDSDAHSVSDLGNMPYGVGAAQRGWLTRDDVINTWPLDKLRAFLRKGR